MSNPLICQRPPTPPNMAPMHPPPLTCFGIYRCQIDDCPNCNAMLDEERDNIEERPKRKPPPETWEERSAKRIQKRAKKSVKEALKEAKDDVKKGKIRKIHEFFGVVLK